jgi:hypothetical protein
MWSDVEAWFRAVREVCLLLLWGHTWAPPRVVRQSFRQRMQYALLCVSCVLTAKSRVEGCRRALWRRHTLLCAISARIISARNVFILSCSMQCQVASSLKLAGASHRLVGQPSNRQLCVAGS